MHAFRPALSRRAFLQGAAATAAAWPLLAVADDKTKKPASDRLTLGFIGMGTMNRGHLGHFLGQKDVQVLAVCDVDTTRRDSAKATVEKPLRRRIEDGRLQGLRRLQRLSRSPEAQRHRRRRHRHPRPLAHHHRHRGLQGEKGHLLREAADAHHPRGEVHHRRRPEI